MPMLTYYVPVPHVTGRHKGHIKKDSAFSGHRPDPGSWHTIFIRNLQLLDDLGMKQPCHRRRVNRRASGDNCHHLGHIPAFSITMFHRDSRPDSAFGQIQRLRGLVSSCPVLSTSPPQHDAVFARAYVDCVNASGICTKGGVSTEILSL